MILSRGDGQSYLGHRGAPEPWLCSRPRAGATEGDGAGERRGRVEGTGAGAGPAVVGQLSTSPPLQVFQRREDGSVNFFRGWEAYRDGFGKLTGEHWLGERPCHPQRWPALPGAPRPGAPGERALSRCTACPRGTATAPPGLACPGPLTGTGSKGDCAFGVSEVKAQGDTGRASSRCGLCLLGTPLDLVPVESQGSCGQVQGSAPCTGRAGTAPNCPALGGQCCRGCALDTGHDSPGSRCSWPGRRSRGAAACFPRWPRGAHRGCRLPATCTLTARHTRLQRH